MERAAVIPDRFSQSAFRSSKLTFTELTKIILIPPFEPDLQIMILIDRIHKLLQQLRTLLIIELVDELRKRPQRKNALPPRHRVGPHHRMHGT